MSASYSQTDTLTIATYNILNYPGSDAAIRNPYFRSVIHSMKPDVLIVQEMQSQAGVTTFLNEVMNKYQSGLYSTIPFNDGPDTDNSFYYRSDKVTFIGAQYINTALRRIAEYTFRHENSGEVIKIYSLHLKANATTDDENKRLAEVTILRDHMNALPANTNFIVGGDFNFYASTEPAYIKLTGSEPDNDGRCFDPKTLTGTWNQAAYAIHHTQSPRVRSFGGGTTGGLDDRFDMLLNSFSLTDNLISASYKAYGNDGNHYNDSINRLPNTAVPDSVAHGLHYAADHIPVVAKYVFQSGTGNITISGLLNDFGSVPVGGFSPEQNYSVSANGLTGNLVITPPTGFQVSTVSGSGFVSSLSIPHSGGVINSVPIYVRFAPASAGSFSGSINHASSGVSSQLLSVSGTGIAATVILAWEMNTLAGNEVSVNSTTTNANLNTSTLSRGSAINASPLVNAFSSTNFSGTTLANAVSTNQFLQFSISVKSGYRVSLSTLDANFRRSSTGPNKFQWQYSMNGFASAGTNIGSEISYTTTEDNGLAQTQINLSTISDFQNVSSNTTITVRLYGYNASATGGTFAIGRLSGNDLTIGGALTVVTPVITPSTSSISGFGNIEVGSISSVKSFLVSGSDLSENISITTPSGFEISTSSSSEFGNSLSLIPTSGSVPATTIYVRFKPTLEQYYSGNIALTSSGATTKNISVSGTGLAVEPTIQASNLTFSSVGLNSMTLSWTNGNGANRIVVARSGSAVNSHTVDGSVYSPNSIFGNGSQIGTGNFVVYSGSGNSVTVTGLTANTTYHFAVCEFNGSGISTNYFTSPPAIANRITLSVLWKEDFETGTKNSYAIASVTCTKGSWIMNEALLGNSTSDIKNGLQSVRQRNDTSNISMDFDKPNGAATVSVLHAKYGSDGNSTWKLQFSTNSGSSWIDNGSTITTSSTTLVEQNFTINKSGNIRLKILKLSGGGNRINFDDIIITDYDKTYEGSDIITGTFGNVTLINIGTEVTMIGNTTINGTLTLNPGTELVIANNTLTIQGNIVDNGGIITGGNNSNLIINGSVSSANLCEITLNNLTLNRPGGLNLHGNITINNLLTLTSGNITTGENEVVIRPAGSISRTNGHIIGNLKKYVPAGAASRTFEIGDASNYTPVYVEFGNVSIAGNLTASTTIGTHPNISTAAFTNNKILNRYYSLTNDGIIFSSYSATFNFVSGDILNGADWNKFEVKKYDGANWSSTTIGTRTTTSTQAIGLTSFSDFAIGESYLPLPAPTNLQVVTVLNNQISLNWTDNANDELGYRVYRANVIPPQLISGNLPPNTTTFTDTGLLPNTKYIYRVLAYNGEGEGTSAELQTYTQANFPGIKDKFTYGKNSIFFLIDKNSNPENTEYSIFASVDTLTSRYVQADGSLNTTQFWQTFSSWNSGGFFQIINLVPSTNYYIKPIARNANLIQTPTNNFELMQTDSFSISSSIKSGWNLLSIPTNRTDFRKSSVFPFAMTSAFGYQNVYSIFDTLQRSKGYWMKFNSATTIEVNGSPCSSDTFYLNNGWNLLGSISVPVAAENVIPDPIGLLITPFWGFDGSYALTDTIKPMKGYWVKANGLGKLILNSSSIQLKRSETIMLQELDSCNTIGFRNSSGDEQKIYFTQKNGFLLDKFEKPPIPSQEIFDVRFKTSRIAEVVSENVGCKIMMQSGTNPLFINWNIRDGSSYELLIGENGNEIIKMIDEGSVIFNNNEINLLTLKIAKNIASYNQIPTKYILSQNQPNPFNPSTTISFSLPITSHVRINILNLLGEKVTTLTTDIYEAGEHNIKWTADVPSGVYFYEMVANPLNSLSTPFRDIKKMLVLK